ncbi:UNVERIFIED_CONTAM: hypothetical protein K2H54_055697 [Gekko kuhli]
MADTCDYSVAQRAVHSTWSIDIRLHFLFIPEGGIPLSQVEAGAKDNGEGDMEDFPPQEGTSTSTKLVACEHPVTENPTDSASGVILRELSPKSCLAFIRARTKQISAVQKFGKEMIRHSIQHREMLLEAIRKEHGDFMNVMNASLQEERQTQEVLGGVLKDLTQAI